MMAGSFAAASAAAAGGRNFTVTKRERIDNFGALGVSRLTLKIKLYATHLAEPIICLDMNLLSTNKEEERKKLSNSAI